MQKPDRKRSTLVNRVTHLQDRLAELEDAMRAIRGGEVDALVVAGPGGEQIYTLQGADRPYRILVENMQEGAATLTPDGLILYANQQLAGMVKTPLESVIGSQAQEFIVPQDRDSFRALLQAGGRGEVSLQAEDGSSTPVLLSVSNFAVEGDSSLCLIATDLTAQKRREEIVAAEQLARGILDQVAEAVVVVDLRGKIVRASQAAHRLSGVNVLLRDFEEVFPLQASSGPVSAMPAAARRSEMLSGLEASFIRGDNDVRQVVVTAGPLRGTSGAILGDVVTLTDITDRRRDEALLRAAVVEKETLLREVHHRVKNNLQVISSLLNLQAGHIRNKKALEVLNESRTRVRSIALVHETLYQSKDVAKVEMEPYIRALGTTLFRTYGVDERIRFQIVGESASLDVSLAFPCGLLLNELITNALKHAFPNKREGELCISLDRQGENFVLIVSDNGVGLPESPDLQHAESLGLQLVSTLTDQLRGKLRVSRKNGTEFRITFPAGKS